MIRKSRLSTKNKKKKIATPKTSKKKKLPLKPIDVAENDTNINMMKEITYYEHKKLRELNELLKENKERLTDWEEKGYNTNLVKEEIASLTSQIEELESKPSLISVLASNIQNPQSYREFNTGKMSLYMKIEGSHGLAVKRMAREWDGYKDQYVTSNGDFVFLPDKNIVKLKSDKWYKKKTEAKNNKNDNDLIIKHFDRYYLYSNSD